tara:strand:- start:5066 stop:6757 length:1692 start_codon:yes stop_codon:yes gene_type:complete
MPASESGSLRSPSPVDVLQQPDRAIATWLLLASAGVCWWAAFPPLNAWPLVVVAAFALIRAADGARSGKLLFISCWVVFTIVWLWMQRWTMTVTGPGYPVFAVYLGIYSALVTWLFRRFQRDSILRKMPSAILAPLVIVAVECLRGLVVFDGYPWYLSGHPLIHWSLLVQVADIMGAWWGSILVFSVAGLLFDLRHAARRSAGSLLTVGVLLAFTFGYGSWRLGQEDCFAQGPDIAAVQTNLPQDNKVAWSWSAQQQDIPSFMSLTVEAVADDVDLVVWPETMAPGLGFEATTIESIRDAGGGFDYLAHWPSEIRSLAKVLQVPMLVGSPTWLDLEIVQEDGVRRIEAGRRHNSAVLVSPGGATQRYDKVALTPFGEFMPYVEHWPWLEKSLMAFGAGGMSFNLQRGDAVRRLQLSTDDGATYSIGTPICFEDTMPHLCRELVYPDGEKKADLLVNMSNDGWFGGDTSVRAVHGMAARFRCIENRIPMLRAVNTGQTAYFDSSGRIVSSLPSLTSGWLAGSPRLDARSTIYGRYLGDGAAWFVFVLVLSMLAWTWRPEKVASQ